MTTVRVVIEGADELKRKFEALEGAVRGQVLAAAVEAGALLVQNDAKRRAPYKTGTLRRSITSEVKAEDTRAEARVGTQSVPYARRIEYGFEGADKLGRVYHQPARPYLRPALDENQDAVEQEIRAAFEAAIRGAT